MNNSQFQPDIFKNVSVRLSALISILKNIRQRIDLRETRNELQSMSEKYEK